LYTANGTGKLYVSQPASKLRKCLINTARISKLGKTIERAIYFDELNLPLIYDGPKDIDALFRDKKFTSRLSVGLGGKRIMRVRPQFFPWALTATALFVEDAGINFDEFQRVVEMAGQVEGIGDGRAIGYGRFTGKVVEDK
jgi:hypothetical protein